MADYLARHGHKCPYRDSRGFAVPFPLVRRGAGEGRSAVSVASPAPSIAAVAAAEAPASANDGQLEGMSPSPGGFPIVAGAGSSETGVVSAETPASDSGADQGAAGGGLDVRGPEALLESPSVAASVLDTGSPTVDGGDGAEGSQLDPMDLAGDLAHVSGEQSAGTDVGEGVPPETSTFLAAPDFGNLDALRAKVFASLQTKKAPPAATPSADSQRAGPAPGAPAPKPANEGPKAKKKKNKAKNKPQVLEPHARPIPTFERERLKNGKWPGNSPVSPNHAQGKTPWHASGVVPSQSRAQWMDTQPHFAFQNGQFAEPGAYLPPPESSWPQPHFAPGPPIQDITSVFQQHHPAPFQPWIGEGYAPAPLMPVPNGFDPSSVFSHEPPPPPWPLEPGGYGSHGAPGMPFGQPGPPRPHAPPLTSAPNLCTFQVLGFCVNANCPSKHGWSSPAKPRRPDGELEEGEIDE